MKPQILIVTASDEPNVKNVLRFMDGATTFRLDTDLLLRSIFRAEFGIRGERCEFEIGGDTISLEEVRSVWYRRPATPKAHPDLSDDYRAFAENECQKFLHALWTTVPHEGVLWVNHPAVLRKIEFNKPYQTRAARRVGLTTPDALVTNDCRAVREFFERWKGEVVVKIFGGNVLKDEEGHHLSIYTSRLSREMLATLGSDFQYAPVMLENYIPKRFELRVTTIGEEIFACAIHSQDSPRTRDDWRRYDFNRVRHESYELPKDVGLKVKTLMKELDLNFGAIDMIVTPSGDHVFLEVNPSGQWGWIERLADLPISEAVARLLRREL